MKVSDWSALLVAIAGVLAALGAIPATNYRAFVLITACALILVALLIAFLPRQQAKARFKIVTPQPGQGIDDGEGVVVSGTVDDLRSGALWVFEEGLISGQRVWFFGGEALVYGNNWSFDYAAKTRLAERTRRTLSIVRADRNCKMQFRSVRPDSNDQLIVYDPPPHGCEILGQISILVSVQP